MLLTLAWQYWISSLNRYENVCMLTCADQVGKLAAENSKRTKHPERSIPSSRPVRTSPLGLSSVLERTLLWERLLLNIVDTSFSFADRL